MPATSSNPFDQFDQAPASNAFDQFDASTATDQAAQPSLLDRYLKSNASYIGPMTGIDPVGHFATSMIATPIAGLAGLGAAATNAVGLTHTPAGNVVNEVSDALTYQPRSKAGQDIVNVASYPFRKLGEAADAVGNALNNPSIRIPTGMIPGFPGNIKGGPELAAIANTAIQAAPMLFTKGRAPEAAAKVPKPVPEVTPRQALAQELVAKKLKLTPSQVGDKAGQMVEGLADHAKLERTISIKNAPEVNRLAGEDVGLKNVKTITEADLNKLKVEANKPYREISQTGVRKTSDAYRQEIANIGDRTGGESFAGDVPPDVTNLKKYYGSIKQFNAADAIKKISQLRSEASQNIKAPNAPEQNAKGYVQRDIANALDNELARHVESIGKPELAAKYQAARVQLAKIHTLEDALDGGNVSAKELAKALNRDAPLSGNMALIAKAYNEFGRSFQDVSGIRNNNPFGFLDLVAAFLGGHVNPALALAVGAKPAARAALASDAYQRRFIGGGSPSAQNVSPVGVPNSLATAGALDAPNALSERRRK